MCGIVGLFQVDGEPRLLIDPETFDAMTDVMTHRGPDDRGDVVGPGFALGARRLSIVDVEGGHQPVANEQRHGRRGPERRALQPPRHPRGARGAPATCSQSRCDTEILPHLYEEVGAALPERLRGKFALAVWDTASAARRPRPRPAGREAALLRRGRRPRRLRLRAEGRARERARPARARLRRDRRVPRARLRAGAADAAARRCASCCPGTGWSSTIAASGSSGTGRTPSRSPERRRAATRSTAERLLELLEDAVASRLMSDVPLGAMLSGGLDSSLVVALMARQMSEPVKTFTVGFAGTRRQRARRRRGRSRAHSATDHHELELSLADPIDLDALVWSLDEPLADLSALGFGALSALAARACDGRALGPGRRRAARRLRAATGRLVPSSGSRGCPAHCSARRPRDRGRASRLGRAARVGHARTIASPRRSGRALPGAADSEGPCCARRPRWASGRRARRRDRGSAASAGRRCRRAALVLDGQLSLVDDMLHYFDRTSMAHSLEVRVPFLDHHVVEFCAQVPGEPEAQARQEGPAPPGRPRDRPRRGPRPTESRFLQQRGRPLVPRASSGVVDDVLLDPAARYAELIDPAAVAPLLAEQSPSYRSSKFLLSVFMLELWLTRYLPRATAGPCRRGSAPA